MNTIEIRSYSIGQDTAFIVTGGVAHIGAVATAYWTEGKTIQVDVISMPGHREAELVEELARMAAIKLGRTVVVVAGIHLEKPTKQEIEDIVKQTLDRMRQILSTD